MKKMTIGIPSGFHVMHDTQQWRIAYHAYAEGVNSVNDIKTWGIHTESDEAFILLKGNMLLVTAGTLEHPEKISIVQPSVGEICIVEQGEKHLVVLEEDAVVAIMENSDMSASLQIDVEEEQVKAIVEAFSA